jgi:hypothetical protein
MISKEEECDELKKLFDLQWTRMREATVFWQQRNPGNDLVWPDLGTLLDWLVTGYKAGIELAEYYQKVDLWKISYADEAKLREMSYEILGVKKE